MGFLYCGWRHAKVLCTESKDKCCMYDITGDYNMIVILQQ